MNEDKFILVLGGARSGKSEFAEELVKKANLPVTYIATAKPKDEEMEHRILLHKQRRPPDWKTEEENYFLPQLVERCGQNEGVLLIDCLTVWATNLLIEKESPYSSEDNFEKERLILEQAELLAQKASESKAKIIMVANELGLGVIPAYPLGRTFRDVAGRVNRAIAKKADKVYLVIAGLAIDIKDLAVNINFQELECKI